MDPSTGLPHKVSTEFSPPTFVSSSNETGGGDGARVSQPDDESSESASFFERVSSMSNSVLSWIFSALFATQLIILSFLTVAWLSLFHVAQVAMPKTFAWEIVITLLGSYYNDCIQSGPDSSSVRTLQPYRNSCTVDFTLPWIPLVGGMTCLLTFFTLSWAVARVVFFQNKPALWIKLLTVLCSLDTANWIIAIIHFSTASMYKRDLREHMKFTLNLMTPEQLPGEIYFRWNVSQTILKCCGVFGPVDWQYSIHKMSDPRFPKSCCDLGSHDLNFQCSQRLYPDRYHIYNEGCFPQEMSLVASYEEWTIFLLALSVVSTVFLAVLITLLAIFTRKFPCSCQLFPRMREINVTLLRKSINCRFDNHHYDNQQKRPPAKLISFKKTSLGLFEFEDSKSDNPKLCQETSV